MAMRAAFLMATFLAYAPQVQAAPSCHCSRDVHRLSAQDERAQTARLNREYLAAATARPVVREARKPTAYQSELDQYRALRDGYDRRLRDYYRAVPPPQATARMQPPPAAAASVPGNEIGFQDRNRLDPWHGYNSGPANGY